MAEQSDETDQDNRLDQDPPSGDAASPQPRDQQDQFQDRFYDEDGSETPETIERGLEEWQQGKGGGTSHDDGLRSGGDASSARSSRNADAPDAATVESSGDSTAQMTGEQRIVASSTLSPGEAAPTPTRT